MTHDPRKLAPREPEQEHVAVVSGDRLCISCGYSLSGQRIVREPHHGLLIVRCPECGEVTSVQEYPLLGRWAMRWGVVLATLWFLFVVAAWPLSASTILRFTMETAQRGSSRYGAEIRRIYRDARSQEPAPAPALVAGGILVPTTATSDFEAWWKDQNAEAILADAGGWFEAVDWHAMWVWLPATLVTFCLGWFWSMVLLHLRRRALLLWGIAVIALAATFVMTVSRQWRTAEPVSFWLAAGRAQLGPPLLFLTLAWCAIVLAAGLLLGRSVTRLMIRALLSPRFRGPLAVVWRADGLEPPSTRRGAGSG